MSLLTLRDYKGEVREREREREGGGDVFYLTTLLIAEITKRPVEGKERNTCMEHSWGYADRRMQSTRTVTYHSVSLSTKNPSFAGLGSNPAFRCERPAT